MNVGGICYKNLNYGSICYLNLNFVGICYQNQFSVILQTIFQCYINYGEFLHTVICWHFAHQQSYLKMINSLLSFNCSGGGVQMRTYVDLLESLYGNILFDIGNPITWASMMAFKLNIHQPKPFGTRDFISRILLIHTYT